jgi:hypothetical protein
MSSSGASTPRGAMTPPPGGDGGPSPLTVGTRFVKQYYKVLSTTPDQIHRFYQPTSFLSHGQGSQPTQPMLFERMQQQQMEEDAVAAAATAAAATSNTSNNSNSNNSTGSHELLKQRFVLKGYEDCAIRFEFEHGAIDAQVSVNGGVLLVVTGHVAYLRSVVEEQVGREQVAEQEQRRKAFVHTFFLGSISTGTKRSYYVHNDILRFLDDDQDHALAKVATAVAVATPVPANVPATVPETTTTTTTAGPVAPVKVVPDVRASTTNGGASKGPVKAKVASGGGVEETKEPEVGGGGGAEPAKAKDVAILATPVKSVADSGPGGGVEESKDDMLIDPPRKHSTSAGAVTGTLEGAERLMSKPKPSAGSWASLVASSGPSAASTPTPGTPARPSATAKQKPSPVAAAANNTSTAASTSSAPVTPKRPTPVQKATTTTTAETKPESGNRANRSNSNKRDPDCTLVIKNIDSATTEPDVIALFEIFSIQTESKIVGITVSANRGIAFVDYDAAAPVLKAVEQHNKEPMQIRGRVLEIYQKTLEQRARRGGGSGGGSGGGGSGGRGVYRGGGQSGGEGGRGGGRQQFRRGTGGRGDRGGDTGGRGGRGGGGSAGRGDRAGR